MDNYPRLLLARYSSALKFVPFPDSLEYISNRHIFVCVLPQVRSYVHVFPLQRVRDDEKLFKCDKEVLKVGQVWREQRPILMYIQEFAYIRQATDRHLKEEVLRKIILMF